MLRKLLVLFATVLVTCLAGAATLRERRLSAGDPTAVAWASAARQLSVGDELTLALFEDVTVRLVIVADANPAEPGTAFLAASAANPEMCLATLKTGDTGFQLSLDDPSAENRYEVVTSVKGVLVRELSRAPIVCEELPPAKTVVRGLQSVRLEESKSIAVGSATAMDDKAVDMLIVFDTTSAAWLRGQGKTLQDFADDQIAKLNLVKRNSGMPDAYFAFRLRGILTLDYCPGLTPREALRAVEVDADVKARRELLRADLVTIYIDTGSAFGTTGIANQLTETSASGEGDDTACFAACAVRSANSGYVTVHEVGHNLGAGHSNAEVINTSSITPGPGSYPYSCGYYLLDAAGSWYHTVMAYNWDGLDADRYYAPVPYYSTPRKSYSGVALGTVAVNDNARAVSNLVPRVSNYRMHTSSISSAYTATFYGNGGTFTVDGTSRTSTSVRRSYGAPCDVLPTPERAGYVFRGFYPSASGEGVLLQSTQPVYSNSFYYAKWSQRGDYRIVFDCYDGVTPQETRTFEYGTATSLPTIASFGWAPSNLVFKGWATSTANADAGKVWKTNGGTVATPTAEGTTMYAYAIWAPRSDACLLRFQKNDGSGVRRNFTYRYGETTVLPDFGWTRAGYVFRGWSLTADGSVWKGAGGKVATGFPAGSQRSVYALWAKEDPTYTVVFHRYDGVTPVTSKTFTYGTLTPLPGLASFGWARKGQVFRGWATSAANAEAGKIWKADGAQVATPTAAGTTLHAYAVWGLADGYYGVRFRKNDGSSLWRTAAYPYGVATTLPSAAGGLGWTIEGRTFQGWSKSSAGSVWVGDRGILCKGVPAGTRQELFGQWK